MTYRIEATANGKSFKGSFGPREATAKLKFKQAVLSFQFDSIRLLADSATIQSWSKK